MKIFITNCILGIIVSVPLLSSCNNPLPEGGVGGYWYSEKQLNSEVLVRPRTGLFTSEQGDVATFTVQLKMNPYSDVVIEEIVSGDAGEGIVETSALTFTPNNWHIPQSVTVTGVPDELEDEDQSYTIQMGRARSNDELYNGVFRKNVYIVNRDDDIAGILTEDPPVNLTSESETTIYFGVKLRSEPYIAVTVPVSSSDISEGILWPSVLTFLPENWNVIQSVTVKGRNDDLEDEQISYHAMLGPAVSEDTDYSEAKGPDVTLHNDDDDTAGITVLPLTLTTAEDGLPEEFIVVLTSEPFENVTIPAIVSGDTSEGILNLSALTFTPSNWNIPQTVAVTPQGDDIDDSMQTYTIDLGSASSADSDYNFAPDDVVVINNDDTDTHGVTVSPTAGLVTSEAGATANFEVALTSEPLGDVSIVLSTDNSQEGDTAPASQTLIFTPLNWSANQTVTVQGQDDFIDDGNITYTVTVDPGSGVDPLYDAISDSTVVLTNTDDDAAGINVTFSPTNPPYFIMAEEGKAEVFSIVLDTQPTDNVTIPATSNFVSDVEFYTAGAACDPALSLCSSLDLVFTPSNWDTAQTVFVSAEEDGDVEGIEGFFVSLGNGVSGTDTVYGGMIPSVSNQTGAIVDNDAFDISLSRISPSTDQTRENGTPNAVYYVLPNQRPSDDTAITLNIASDDTTEGTVSPTTLTFTTTDWLTVQSFTVVGVNDNVEDGDQAYTVSVDGSGTDYTGVSQSLVVTNKDNDSGIAGVQRSPGFFSQTEGEADVQQEFTLKLKALPFGNVTVGPIDSEDTEAIVVTDGPGLYLTFTPANWNTLQTVTLTFLGDATVDGRKNFDVTTGVATTDSVFFDGYDGFATPKVLITYKDNEHYIYATDTKYNGDLGGVSGADTKCNDSGDANYPAGGGTYKAFLADDSDRNAPPSASDWVLSADHFYYQKNGTTQVFQADGSKLFDFTTLSFAAVVESGTEGHWAGLNTDWSQSTDNCNDWTDGTSGFSGALGKADQTDDRFLYEISETCDKLKRLVCVEQ